MTNPTETTETPAVLFVTYNICDDRIRVKFAGRLPKDDYDAIHEAGYQHWPKQGIFTATWTVHREDVLARFGITSDAIEAIEEEDDPEARKEKYEEYAENAAERGNGAYERVHQIADRIPFGQPILVGHHSERSARADQRRIERGMDKAVTEWGKAEYWKRRAAGTVRRAERRSSPGVIARRIKELEAEERKYRREIDRSKTTWQPVYHYGGIDTAGHYGTREEQEASWTRHVALYTRWLQHVQAVLAYQRHLYTESGGTLADAVKFEVGGHVTWHGYRAKIVKVNPTTVKIEPKPGWRLKLDKSEITNYEPPNLATPDTEETE